MDPTDADLTAFQRLVLKKYPYPVAVGYRRILQAPTWEAKARRTIEVFDFSMRTVALGLVSQYSTRDADKVKDPALDALLGEQLRRATLGSWKNILFTALAAYKDRRELFFIPELYDLYWDVSHVPNRPKKGIHVSYDRLITIRNDLEHGIPPETEAQWQVVAEECIQNLDSVLNDFSFIERYDLVLIVEHLTGNAYSCVIYTGEHPINSAEPRLFDKELEPGWLYLSKGNEDCLPLHPLLILWRDPMNKDVPSPLIGDAAIYNTFTNTAVKYLAPVMRRNIVEKDPQLVKEFAQLIADILSRMTGEHLDVEHLTWTDLQTVAGMIAGIRFGDVSKKYRSDLYLQRRDVKVAFDDFLISNKTAFLLLGKSGVGKSSFFLSLAEEYQSQDQVCLLLYNGATLEADSPLRQIIGRDFAAHLHFISAAQDQHINDFLDEIAQIRGIEQHKVILFVDAINENAEARTLLSRIDELIASVPYPWFKVVISSRPEAWRAIKRGLKLPEHLYFSLPGQPEPGVELQPFGVEMTNFTRAELPDVYEKYRQAYELQTPYSDIPRDLRNLLNDPLTLKLVAETYRGKPIPQTIRPGEIYEKYVDQLVRDGRLDPADPVFLEGDLMPFMISEGHFDNKVTADQVTDALTTSGRALRELIHSDERLSNGRAINQSFKNLVDAEILVSRGGTSSYEIAFKYERFYDYYGGKRIYKLAAKHPDRYAFFLEMIAMTGKPTTTPSAEPKQS